MRFLFAQGAVWVVLATAALIPAPQSTEITGSGYLQLSPGCQLVADASDPVLVAGFDRMLAAVLVDHKVAMDSPPCFFNVLVQNPAAELQMGVDESYLIHIEPETSTVSIQAATVWGALHSFSTIRQMASLNLMLQLTFITDSPHYTHRGLMLDSARNFLTVESILEQIDIMSQVKMNVLHWHLVDSQSWPIAMASLPDMAQDAYSHQEVYTSHDISRVVAHARMRGVRIIPEVDMPGHARAGWRQVGADVVVCADSKWDSDQTAVEPPPGQLNVVANRTYEVVRKVYREISALFSEDIFHVGHDEVSGHCYLKSESTRKWLAGKGISSLIDYWLQKSLPIFRDKKTRRLAMWEDILLSPANTSDLPKDVILQTWKSPANIQQLTSRGYDVIVSSSAFLYLDCGVGTHLTNEHRYVENPGNHDWNYHGMDSWCGPYKTWQRIYAINLTSTLTPEEKKHVLGYEAPLWSEQVDSHVLTQKLWPRAAALAEVTWSGNQDSEGRLRMEDFGRRLMEFREMLVKFGHNPSAIAPKWCAQNPGGCRSFL